MQKQSLYFYLQNNTSGTIPVYLLNPSLPYNNIANQHTRYAWDISSATYSPLSFSIQAKFAASASFVSYGGGLAAGNVSALLAALNNLGIGVFWSETSGSSTYIVTWNDGVIYGNLTVGTTSTTSVNLYWINNTIVAGGSLQIKVNAVTIVTSLNPGNAADFGNILVNNADVVLANVTASPGEPTYWEVSQTLIASPYTITILYSNTVAGSGSDSYSFAVSSLYNYEIKWGYTL